MEFFPDNSLVYRNAGAAPGTNTKKHTGWVYSVSFSPDGVFLASGSDDKNARLWSVNTGQCLKILQEYTDMVWSVAFSPKGDVLLSGSSDGTLKLWDLQTGTCLSTLRGNRPYERMNITGLKSFTEEQKASLRILGAIDREMYTRLKHRDQFNTNISNGTVDNVSPA